MKNLGLLIGIFAFIGITLFVLSVDNTEIAKPVKFSNQDFAISHKANDISDNKNINVSVENTKITNKNINTENQTSKIKTSEVNYENSTNFENDNFNYKTTKTNYKNKKITYKNLDDTELDRRLNEIKNNSYNKQEERIERSKYIYKNIDWNTWQSNFVNQILDDSLSIKELDQYPPGSWLYYSFNVDKNGYITDVTVMSPHLSTQDKDKFMQLIKSYQFHPITYFPKNSQRQKAKVKSIMVLSNETKKANPKDFNDNEHIKIKINY